MTNSQKAASNIDFRNASLKDLRTIYEILKINSNEFSKALIEKLMHDYNLRLGM